MGQHWIFLTVSGIILAALLYIIGFTLVRKSHITFPTTAFVNLFRRDGYTALKKRDDEELKAEV